MAALIQALDNETNKQNKIQLGENNHTEYAWSKDIQEKIIQFDFQCVRITSTQEMQELANKLEEIIQKITTNYYKPLHISNAHKMDVNEQKRKQSISKQYLILLYKLIAKTRDIKEGKGEYALSYMMIWTWYKYFPELAMNALYLFVVNPEQEQEKQNQEPYGSWKDIKYMCEYARQQGANTHHPLIQYCITLINMILYNDDQLYNSTNNINNKVPLQSISLVSKWIARESSNKFGWLNEGLATHYFYHYLLTAKTQESMQKAIRKCKTQYRQLIAKLNRHIDTIQIKQAGGRWAEIDHSKTTSITLVKNRKALLNVALDNPRKTNHHSATICRSVDPDRVQCAENFKQYLETLKQTNKTVKGKNVGLNTFTSEAIKLIQECERNNNKNNNNDTNKIETDILNSQWENNSTKKNANSLGNIIAIVDTSGSMSGGPMNAAIALGCRVAEKSCLGKRIMTFSAEPNWINLDDCNTFTEMVQKIIIESNAGYNTDFYKALNLILLAIEENKIPIEEVENMVLAIFSDMQIDDNLYITFKPLHIENAHGNICNAMHNYLYSDNNLTQFQKENVHKEWNTLYEKIKQQYHAVGMRLYNKPMNPPHILFWNLRNTTGFPALSTQQNMSMMSGFDPTILNKFCEYGIDALKGMTAWSMFTEQLNNPRYMPMETALTYIVQ